MSVSSVEKTPAVLPILVKPAEPALLPQAQAIARLPNVPASFFGIVLGLAGLGNAWRAATAAWHLPAVIGEGLMAAATIVWAILVLLYGLKWVFRRKDAMAEALHPVLCCFIGLGGVSTMLISLAVLPYSHPLGLVLFAAGGLFTLSFGVWRTGLLWQGGRDPAATTPVLYLPTVAGGFVGAAAAAAFGYPEWGQFAFGAALLAWLAIESVLLHRFYTLPEMPAALRPTLGIQLAPPAVGAVAYYAVNGGHADLVVNALMGYGILQALILLRLLPWLLKQPFTASYWAYTFGAAALTTTPLRMIAHGQTGPATQIAPVLFIAANVVIGLIALATIRLLLQGRLLPAAAPAPALAPVR
ncbi:dicarboxylate transporter/tellurite-resistance protein TehA [Acidisoma cellulosilytica]|uniref:Dicarboxylate transporter/tellurite-resistance protein TehA n=1 Tax=Acidisoma cellulosilyticum TaxID=2802395 RepID=A0A963Z3B8_9PROT|nr:dicarboxylate transporter/tellurite-resistance protein TehA [Acidisoma cellulosilyticum]MCB8882082.1 dicarboxylate transporter/tellurite-resistance protein TehA [Acidisoma cellulosilyticum]